ncbi:MAG TPA: hypothetical protein VFE07_12210, partial [Marmoricola sp.]|nr:hypothetical protein [Marmoricola sp.]
MTRVGAWLMAAVLSAAGLTAVLPEASADPVIEHGTALPAIPDGHVVSSVAISGDFVYAALRATPASVETPTILYRTTADGSGAWSPVIDPDTDQPLQASAFRVDGSAVVVLDSQPGEPPCDSYRIIEGGAARSFTSCSFPVVGDGGLIARRDEGNAWLIEDHDGFLVDTAETQPALDGSQVWTYDAGLITGFDTASKTALP